MNISKKLPQLVKVRSIIVKNLECSGKIYGCNSCFEIKAGADTFVKCYSCMDSLYLLANKTDSTLYPSEFSFCVPDCKSAHYSYINNPVTGNCTFCGDRCSSCNIKTGCEYCEPDHLDLGWVNALMTTSTYSTF